VFGFHAKEELDDLRNSISSQIEVVYLLDRYTKGILASAKKLCSSHNANIVRLKTQQNWANN
jgi:hypothetical protein